MKKGRGRFRAFSLIEMLSVIAVLVVLMVMVLPATNSILESSSVTRSGQIVVDQIAKARQLASARGCTVEVRLVKLTSQSPDGYSALEVLVPNAAGTMIPVGRVMSFPESMVVSESAALSPFVANLPSGSRGPDGPWAGAPYKSFRIRPSGIVEPVPAVGERGDLFLTVVNRRFAHDTQPPSNYLTVQLNPDTANTLVYRP